MLITQPESGLLPKQSGGLVFLGSFAVREQAAAAHDIACLKAHPEMADGTHALNFPITRWASSERCQRADVKGKDTAMQPALQR